MTKKLVKNIVLALALSCPSAYGCSGLNENTLKYNCRQDVIASEESAENPAECIIGSQGKPFAMQPSENNTVEKYAIVVVGSSRGERYPTLSDKIDKNGFLIGGTYNYRNLKELGFKVRFLYADGNPDYDEQVNHEILAEIKEDYKGKKSRLVASIKNLEALIDEASKEVDSNDVFVFSISTHGNPYVVEMHNGLEDMTYVQMRDLLKKVKPGFGMAYIDACHSGAFVKNMALEDYVVISTTGDHTYGWGDREFSGSRYFFNSLLNPESDANVDGYVTVSEAFEKSKNDALAHMERINNYLLNTYNWDEEGSSHELIKSLSVVPYIRVGKNSSSSFYFFDSWYFDRNKQGKAETITAPDYFEMEYDF